MKQTNNLQASLELRHLLRDHFKGMLFSLSYFSAELRDLQKLAIRCPAHLAGLEGRCFNLQQCYGIHEGRLLKVQTHHLSRMPQAYLLPLNKIKNKPTNL